MINPGFSQHSSQIKSNVSPSGRRATSSVLRLNIVDLSLYLPSRRIRKAKSSSFCKCQERPQRFIKCLRQYAHSHWSIGVFKCKHGCYVTLSFLKPFPSRSLSQVQILSNSNEENFSKFWFGDWPSLPHWARGNKAKERKTTALCMHRC